ncbi:MAG: hypothetical protein M3277_11930 [Actinomycetota bacterium]|nr:hypothetical protein [Actinomycetota bacterium]
MKDDGVLMASGCVRFEKWTAQGNSFVIVAGSRAPGYSEGTLRALSLRSCSPHFGLGADNLLLIELQDAQSDRRGEFRMIEPDGSEAAMCGNGLGCAAAMLACRDEAPQASLLFGVAASTSKPMDCRVIVERRDDVWAFEIDLGAVEAPPDEFLDPAGHLLKPIGSTSVFDVTEIVAPILSEIRTPEGLPLLATIVYTGEPHLVLLEEPRAVPTDAIQIQATGDLLNERLRELLPKGINVMSASLIDGEIRYRSYERNLFRETLSSSTGAAAIAVSIVARGLRGKNEVLEFVPLGATIPQARLGSERFAQWATVSESGVRVGSYGRRLAAGELTPPW